MHVAVEQLARDYAATLTAGLVRYGVGWKKHANGVVTRRTKELRQKRRGEFTGEDLAALEQTRCEQEVWLAAKMNWLRTGWMIGRREQVDFQTLMPSSLRGLPNFNPPALPAGTKPSLVDIAPQGSGTPVTSGTKAFLVELRRRATGFDAGNYAGHGGGTFRGRGFSVDRGPRIVLHRSGRRICRAPSRDRTGQRHPDGGLQHRRRRGV